VPEILNLQIADWRGAIAGYFLALVSGFCIKTTFWIRRVQYLALTKTLWRPFIDYPSGPRVVLTTKESSRPSGTPKASLSEVESFHAIRETLEAFKVKANLEHSAHVHLKDIDGGVVSIGGPAYNGVTREALAYVVSRYKSLPVIHDEKSNCFHFGNNKLESEVAPNGTLKRDYGIILRTTQKLGGKPRPLMIAFGLRGRGTWGAVKSLTYDRDVLKQIEREAKKSDLIVLLEFEFLNNELIATKIVSAMGLLSS
jgi:hypothetical protein